MSDSGLSDGNLIEQMTNVYVRKTKLEHLSHNVTDDNKLQEGLKQLYRSIMEDAHFGITLIDLDYKILIANEAIGKKFNKPVSELIGRECFREFEKRDAICPHCPGKQAIATGRSAEAETEGVCDDGSRFSVRIQAFPAIDPNGKVMSFIEVIEEITERKKAEQALSESELRYRTTLNSMLDAIHVVDTDLRIVLMNDRIKQWTKELGIKMHRPVGRKIRDVFPFLPDKVFDEYQQIFKSGKVLTSEESIETAGKHIITEIRKIPIYESGRVVRVVTVIRDITKRKRAEEALRESEEKFRSLAEQSPNMIFINRKGKIVYINKRCEDVMGYEREELYSPEFDFLGLIAPESVDLIKDNFARHLRGEDVPPYDYSLINKQGKRIEVINSSKLIHYEGEMAILGIVTDITERKRAEYSLRDNERFLQDIFNGIKDGISILDRDLNVIRVNKLMERMYASEMPLVGKKCYKIYQRREFSCPCCPSIRTLETGEAHTEIVPYPSAEKRTGWIELSAFPLKGADGSITGVIEHVKDITNRKRAEQRLLEDRAQLKSLASQLSLTEERERREIATELHDRIGQSLVISKIKLDQLRKSVASEELAKTLDEVSDCLELVIQDTRTLTFDLSSPILYELGFEAAVAEWLCEQIQEKYGIRTEFEDDGQSKSMDDDIRVLLFRNVRELLINAAKHSNAQNIKVTVSKAGDRIIVKVEDNGVGFDPVEAASKAAERATFGLFSIRERLEQLEGHLEIISEPGQGSRITMSAPLKCENINNEAQV